MKRITLWAVNVHSSEKVMVELEPGEHIRLTHAHLQVTKNHKNESASLYIEHNGKEHPIATLHSERAPDQSFKLEIAKTFTLSHDSKIGTVCFSGNKYGKKRLSESAPETSTKNKMAKREKMTDGTKDGEPVATPDP